MSWSIINMHNTYTYTAYSVRECMHSCVLPLKDISLPIPLSLSLSLPLPLSLNYCCLNTHGDDGMADMQYTFVNLVRIMHVLNLWIQ